MERQETLQPRYCSLRQIADELGISEMSLRIKLSFANRKGIALPARRRIGKQYLYDRVEFANWLWQNADAIRRPMSPIK